jgi:hypothetical protein
VRPSHRCTLVACICSVFAAPAVGEEPWRIESADRVVALADIHGAYAEFHDILVQVGVVDANDSWAAGTTHLVIVGDVLDRGPDSRLALDLIMTLQVQARATGGDVHLVLGNHEVMNLTGDTRYVSAEEYAAFAAAETPEMRAAGLTDFMDRADAGVTPEAAEAEFNRRYPAGFFAHRAAFGSGGQYGAWLLEQPVLLVAHDSVFVHGGLSRRFSGVSGGDINATLKQQLREYVEGVTQLTAAGVLSPIDDFYDHPALISRFEERVSAGEASWADDVAVAASRVVELNEAAVFALASPTWYRGTVGCSPLVEQDHWTAMLAQLDVERVVVGHTPTPEHRILSRMSGGILRIDTGMLGSYYGGRAAALLIDAESVTAAHAGEANAAAVMPQPRRVGRRPEPLTDDALAALLRDGNIAARQANETGLDRVTVSSDGVSVEADFMPATDDTERPAVAAYALDRLLGLDMVPVTVSRTIDGVDGSLQFRPAGLLTESQRRERGTGGAAWCPLGDQFPAMYVFDTLVFNEGRSVEQIAYDPESFQLLLLGHERTFSTRRGRPAHLREAALDINAAWRDALERLDEDVLSSELGDWLSRRQVRALARRIDELLEDAARD